MIRKCVLCAMLLLVSDATSDAQDEPMGSSIVSSSFEGVRFTFVPAEINSFVLPPRVSANVSFNTMAQTLTFQWSYRDRFPWYGGTATVGRERILEHVDFHPTAVAKKTNSDSALFVAGYDVKTGNVTVQEWCFDLAVNVHEDSAREKVSASLTRVIRKTTLVSSPDMKPIETMMFNQCSDELWLFEDGSPHVLRTVNVNVGAPSLRRVADATTEGYSFLARTKYVMPLFVRSLALDGGGFVAICVNERIWNIQANYYNAPKYKVTALRDTNCDGEFDEILTGTFGDLFFDKDYIQCEDVFR